jgi:Mg2+ and Co2+ transporter CorA
LEKALSENKEQRLTNDRLQYWLAALESENESIGEYISLYRFQRGNIQKKMAEKDRIIEELFSEKSHIENKLTELQSVVVTFLTQQNSKAEQPQTSVETPTESPGTADQPVLPDGGVDASANEGAMQAATTSDPLSKMVQIIGEIEKLKHEAHHASKTQVPASSTSGMPSTYDPLLHCSECRGALFTL